MGALISVFGSFITWVGGYFAAKWGVKVAIAASVVTTYAAMWAAFLAAISALALLLPDSGFPAFLLQFFPSASAISTATAAYYGSMMAKRSFDFWRSSFGLVAKIAGA